MDVRYEVINRVAVITLDRPRALNALSHGMVQQMDGMLTEAAADAGIRALLIRGAGPKAFCAGGDVVALAQSAAEDTALHRDFFVDEYRLDFRIHAFPKPVVVFMHGVVMGGGMGLAQGASLRLVTDNVRIAMPETRIGLVPDVGATHFFSKMPAPLALYLALTGTTIGASDALFVGLADARAKVDDADGVTSLLAEIDWALSGSTDLALLRCALSKQPDGAHLDDAALPSQSEAIFRHFDPLLDLATVVKQLEQSPTDWAQANAATLRKHSPLMLALCREALNMGRGLALPDCFKLEYGLVQYAMQCGEFNEGVRAHLIDKDRAPKWLYSAIEDVGAPVIEQALRRAQTLSLDFALTD